MATYPLIHGFVAQIGERNFAFHRMLDLHTVQLEDVQTGAFRTIPVADLQRQVAQGKIRVVGSSSSDQFLATQEEKMDAIVAVEMLTRDQQEEWQRRQAYVLAMRRRGVSRGNKRRVTELLPLVSQALKDANPSSTSSVVRWLTLYERSGANPAALISKSVARPRMAQIPPSIIDAAWSVLKRFYFRRRGDSLVAAYRRMLTEMKGKGGEKSPDAWTPPSLSTFRRLASRVPAYERDRARLGSAAASAKWRHSTGGTYATRPMERVEMDHTELDLYVIDDDRGLPIGRPTVTMLVRFQSDLCQFLLSVLASIGRGFLGLPINLTWRVSYGFIQRCALRNWCE